MNESRENIQFLREFLATRRWVESYESIPRRAHRSIPYARTHARNAHTNPTHTHTVAHSRRRRPITHRPSSSSIHATHVSSSPSRAKSASKSVLTRIARSIGARARDRIGSDRTRGVIIPPSLPPSRMRAHAHTHGARTPSCMRLYDPWVRT